MDKQEIMGDIQELMLKKTLAALKKEKEIKISKRTLILISLTKELLSTAFWFQ